MNTPFEIQAFDLTRIGASGAGRISCLVNGYWSQDPVSLYVQREWFYVKGDGADYKWKVTFSHSSGGRETSPAKERGVASDLEAATNLGFAIVALAALGRQIEGRLDVLEQAYQSERKLRDEEEAAAKAAKQLLIDADPAVGAESAKNLVAVAIDLAKDRPENQQVDIRITALPRGEEETAYNKMTVLFSRKRFSNTVTVRFNGVVMPKHDAATKLAALSAASVKILSE